MSNKLENFIDKIKKLFYNQIQTINQEISRLNQNDQRHTHRLNRLNQRLREVENRLRISFTPLEDGF